MTRDWLEWADDELDGIRSAGQWRQPREFDAAGPDGTIDGRPVVSFASNDYLGLSQHPGVVAAAHAALDRWGAGSGAARLIVGSRPVHHDLEAALADWKSAEAAVLFPTGFAANLGVLSTFGTGAVILSDELNHASIIDGCRLARAETKVFRHADPAHVDELLAGHGGPAIVVTDTVFSMDGDVAPVEKLAEVCADRGALLVLDEAHAVLAPDLALDGAVVRVGTLSKTLGSLGGFAAGPRSLVDLLVNRARSYIFTTASTPADMAAATAALAIVRSSEGDALRARLRRSIDRLQPGHPSPIIPVVIGDEAATVAAAAALFERGVLVPAIRPPTVAPGTSRLRVALSAAHTDEQIGALIAGLDACVPSWRG
ncbi:MAG: 7-keto-8-aminopelargonate synthetase-like enzyme [Actinomycetia bacterium]|nr:7-keto-8-aminopelargonate synthetase-like enzyme [Actinomycetes bacterium]